MVHLNRCPNKGVTISRFNGRTKTITRLLVRLGKSVLRLGGEVRLGEAMLCLGGTKIAQEGSRVCTKISIFGHFHRVISNQTRINHKTRLKLTKTIFMEEIIWGVTPVGKASFSGLGSSQQACASRLGAMPGLLKVPVG